MEKHRKCWPAWYQARMESVVLSACENVSVVACHHIGYIFDLFERVANAMDLGYARGPIKCRGISDARFHQLLLVTSSQHDLT